MANDLTSIPKVWKVDSVGILSETPVWIKKIIYFPNANDDDLQCFEWQENTPVTNGTKGDKTGTITLTNTLTSTGNLPSDVADGHIFHIWKSTGDSDNLGRKVVETAGDDDKIVIQEDDWTNEASKTYWWRTYSTTDIPCIAMKGDSVSIVPVELEFHDFPGKGRLFPNLMVEVIDGGTAYFYLS